jgi:outer membrane protein assembly factor BamD (BamD/ComL family)
MKRRPAQGIRCALALAAVAAGLWGSRALATGDYYEQPLTTLPDYLRLDQLPAKSFEQIENETRKRPMEGDFIDFREELKALPGKPGAEALASIDRMTAVARAQHTIPLLNLLDDMRDLFAGPAQAAESAAYLAWRLEHAADFGLNWEAPATASAASSDTATAAKEDAVEKQLAKASPALKPHWIYLHGAILFLNRKADESQEYFLTVAHDFPKHPRAEAALFMAARCQLSRARSGEYTQQDMKVVERERPKAKKLFDEYFAKYPHGRFFGDALGWYAAFAYDGRDFATALHFYMQQTDLSDHPELFGAAVEMVEKTLSHIASEPKDKSFAAVAKDPKAAQALVYLIINTSESDNYNGKLESIDEVRGWRKTALPRLGAAIAANAKLYQNADWKPRYLAMLAYAASGAGQQEQALKLLETAGDAAQQNDDLLFARGIVLHRAKRAGEAVAVLRTLLEKFPKSPLAKGARLRLGLALVDSHEGGKAVLALGKLIPKPAKADQPAPDDNTEDSRAEPLLYDIDLDQIRALIDTLLNFAPVEELVAPTRAPGLDPVLRLQLTEPVAERLLAKEQFEEARKYITPAQWELVAAPIARLTKEAEDARDPAAHAAACLKLGDAWAAARGKLLSYPLDTDETRHTVYIDFSANADERRADSAPFIGATGNYKLDLENRDELKHAFKWWLDASDAQPGTALAAQALWRALQAMPQIADVSPFSYDRALARKWSDVSRKIYDRLKKECASSPEAMRYAVAWDFPAPKKNENADNYPTHRAAAGDWITGAEALKIEEERAGAGGDPDALTKELEGLQNEGKETASELKSKAAALADRARKTFTGLYDARWVNLADDLTQFFSEPDPGPEVRERYLELRFRFLSQTAIGGDGYGDDEKKEDADQVLQKDIKTAVANPKFKPVADYFEFLNLAVIANHFVWAKLDPKTDPRFEKDKNGDEETYRSRDYPLLAKETHAFLAKYPKSRKREAALLMEARAIYRASEEVALSKPVTWPQANRWEGGFEVFYTRQEPFDAKRVSAAFDAYDHAYPKGRYTAAIRAYRAAVALRLRDWKNALTLSIAQLEDHADPALDFEVANRLGDVFAQLTDEHFRADILSAIQSVPRAKEFLAQYLEGKSEDFESREHPLRFMKTWLREQLAIK